MAITVTTNGHARELLTHWSLTPKEREDFDYAMPKPGVDEDVDPRFFRYRGDLYDVQDIPTTDPSSAWGGNRELADMGWQGFASDTYFSGIAVRYVDDPDYVVVGRVYVD